MCGLMTMLFVGQDCLRAICFAGTKMHSEKVFTKKWHLDMKNGSWAASSACLKFCTTWVFLVALSSSRSLVVRWSVRLSVCRSVRRLVQVFCEKVTSTVSQDI